MSRIISLFFCLSLSLGCSAAQAAAVCLTELHEGVDHFELPQLSEPDHRFRRLQCRDLQALKTGMEAAVYTHTVVGLGLACSGLATVSVGFAVSGLIVQTAKFVVSQLPCEDGPPEKLRDLVRESVCEALGVHGIPCRD